MQRDDLKVKDVIEFAHKESGIDDLSEARFFSLYSYENYKPERADGKELKQKVSCNLQDCNCFTHYKPDMQLFCVHT